MGFVWGQCQGLGETLAVFYPNKFIPPSPSSLWPFRRMREERVVYDCASFYYYQQEGSFYNLCMKFMSFPGKRRGLTGEGGGQVEGAGRGFLPLWKWGEVWRGGATQLI